MKTLFRTLIAAGALLALSFGIFATPADAAFIRMCRATAAGAASGPNVWKAPTSGRVYSSDPLGCFSIQNADYPDALAAGFAASPGVGVATLANTSTGFSPIQVPAGAYIDSITVQEVSGSPNIGGLKFGTTAGGSDVAFFGAGAQGTATANANISLAAGGLVTIPDPSMRKRAFSSTSPQNIFFDTLGNWNSSGVNITIHYTLF